MTHTEVLRSHEARQRREARELFERHELVRVDGVRAAFAEPGRPCNAFEITCLGWGQVVVSGDIAAVVFDRSDGDDVFQRAAWLAGCDGHKARQRARMATGQEYREFVPAALAQLLLNYEEAATGAAADELADLRVGVEFGDVGEEEAADRASALGVGFDRDEVGTCCRSLAVAHEAARAAHRLLSPGAMWARFTREPSAAALAEYNLAARSGRRDLAERAAKQMDFESRLHGVTGRAVQARRWRRRCSRSRGTRTAAPARRRSGSGGAGSRP